MRLIDADALIDDLMERYCKECNKRKGIKNSKYRIIYEIGEAPCRACEIDDVKAELEQAPTADVPDTNVGDTISRQGAIDMLDKRFDSIPMDQTTEILQLRKDLRELPSAQRKGKWIWEDNEIRFAWTCSECGYGIRGDRAITNFCPNCGARMDGET